MLALTYDVSFIEVTRAHRVVLAEHMKTCADRTKAQLDWLLQIESRPYTLNTHYFADYKAKFLAFYRGSRESGTRGDLIQSLNSFDPNSGGEENPFDENMKRIMAALPQIGITGTQAIDLAKLLSTDPMDPALAIMAGVRAYFQGASNRTL